jgi:hypothetical protein
VLGRFAKNRIKASSILLLSRERLESIPGPTIRQNSKKRLALPKGRVVKTLGRGLNFFSLKNASHSEAVPNKTSPGQCDLQKLGGFQGFLPIFAKESWLIQNQVFDF